MDEEDDDIDPPPPDVWEIKRSRYKKVKELNIVFREEWGAREPLDRPVLKMPVKNVLLTFTNTPPCWDDEGCAKTLRDLQAAQMDNGEVDIHWNFMVGGNGKVYEGRGWFVKPVKAPSMKGIKKSFDIAYIAKNHNKREITEEMKFQKGQVIRFAGENLLLDEMHNFYEDKIILDEIRRRRKEKEKKEKEKKKKRREAKLQKRLAKYGVKAVEGEKK